MWSRQDWNTWGTSEYRYVRGPGDWMAWKHCQYCFPSSGNVALLDGFNVYGEGVALRYVYDWDKDAYVWHVYEADINDFFMHRATLVASNGAASIAEP